MNPVASPTPFLSLGSFARLRMTVRGCWLRVGLIAGMALTTLGLRAETFTEAGRAAHGMLTRLCDDFGGRVTGSAANQGALNRLAEELRTLGLKPEIEAFAMPGWERGDDHVELLVPFARPLRVAALAYTQPHAAFEADVVAIGNGAASEYPADARGKI